MLNVKKEITGQSTVVEFLGTIEESVNFEQLVGETTGDIVFKCRGITRINSVGVKTWIRYFQSLKNEGKKFKFTDCPQPIVEQLNMISNFACGGEVESILLPYYCQKCQKEMVARCLTSDLKKNDLEIPQVKCEKNPCDAKFDDDAEEYFYFLKD